ncbi:SsrA-binding protein SmpB [Spirochaeta africana]|uniref:SsrA-binding protein n=1 Tax=Spirochaeta africana (strain ATCC 700263 / DSM 8902 / Z-7692) TaxID=889378 RepID=H9UJC4_SPIAZ|nr:SsrA-binding protein SmpB [Spirochaeta africana]AFG37617.1 SsrA-binding protein [Spirochaeta africana DSM 8902]
MKNRKLLVKNKRALHAYNVEDTYECGIVLQGTEVKSIKNNKFSFADSHARIVKGELYLYGLHIAQYTHGNIHNHDPDRPRKLLAHKQEIDRMRRRVEEKGYTLIPVGIYLSAGLIKVDIGVCKGKKLHDKRQTIKARDQQRDAMREMRM